MADAGACRPGANPIIERYFHDCIYNGREMTGFAFGLCSIACWMVAQLPQLIANYRRQSADALSPFFLSQWLLGDTANLVGAVLSGDQPETVILTAQYFICMDCVLLIQYLYYTSVARRRERTFTLLRRRRHHHSHLGHDRHGVSTQRVQTTLGHVGELRARVPPVGGLGEVPFVVSDEITELAVKEVTAENPSGSNSSDAARRQWSGKRIATSGALTAIAGTVLLARGPRILQPSLPAGVADKWLGSGRGISGQRNPNTNETPALRHMAGTVVGYLSSALYLVSRISQICKTMQRHSAEGLSSGMFIFAVAANSFYGGSVLLRSQSRQAMISSLPWIIGSLGTVALDIIIIVQSVLFARVGNDKPNSDEEEALLPQETQQEATEALPSPHD